MATLSTIKAVFEWDTMDADVNAFVQSCLVCVLSANGTRVPRPLRHQRHAERVSELIHFDFLSVGESQMGSQYILIIKDDFSGCVFLRSCAKADAESAAEILLCYFTAFFPVLEWFSDQGQHFCNAVMELLASSMVARHRFPTAYVSWSNGTFEAVFKDVLLIMHSVSTEFNVTEADWEKTVPAVQSIMKNSPSRRLGGRAPITVHTCMDFGNPLKVSLSTLK